MRTAAGCLVLVLWGCQTQTDRATTHPPPEPVEAEAPVIEVEAYGGVRFVARPQEGRIDRVVDGASASFAEIEDPRAMLLDGPVLYVGTGTSLVSVSLADGAVSPVAEGLGPVLGLTLDHVGYIVAAVHGRGLVRIRATGEVTDLVPSPVGTLAFDATTRTLLVGATTELDILALTGDDPEAWARRDARPMMPFEIDGIALAGAEYWPYRGEAEPRYPQDVLWGFYPEKGVPFEGDLSPETATPEAVACAEQSYRALRQWVEHAPAAFHDAVAKGRSPRFYLWINDYSEAADTWPYDVRPGRLWYWQRDPPVPGRVPGYWKWETTLTRDGRCQIPQPPQIDAYLQEAAATGPS